MDHLEKYIENQKFLEWVFNPNSKLEKHFSDFFKEHPDEEKKYRQIRKELRLLSIEDHEISYAKGTEIFQSISNKISATKKQRKLPVHVLQMFIRYAAIAIIFFAIGSLFIYFPMRNKTDLKFAEELFLKNAQTLPTLYLTDGSKREVTSENKFIDLSLTNRIVVGNDTINYRGNPGNNLASNVLVVPIGQRLQVRMEDETTIWLNAGSRLIFPHKFRSNKREVYLVGEAFFDVIKNTKKPFFVNTSYLSVKVLGTKFNVSAYPEDNEIVAVLEEGKIQILDNQSDIAKVAAELLPNQLACLTKSNNQLRITNTDSELHTLWKEGTLRFEDEQINQLINKLERYYGIQIILKDVQKGEERVRGKLDLNTNQSVVLEYLTKMTQTKMNQINRNTYILE